MFRRTYGVLRRASVEAHTKALSNNIKWKHDAVKNHDGEVYGGWKSAEILFSKAKEQPSVVGRWDWHAWQFLLALVPAGCVYALAQYARHDMESQTKLIQEDGIKAAAAGPPLPSGAAAGEGNSQVEQRLAALEATLASIKSSLNSREGSNTPIENKSVQTSPNTLQAKAGNNEKIVEPVPPSSSNSSAVT